MRSSSQAGFVLIELRLREIELRHGRHVARLGVVERLLGEQLARVKILRAFEVELGHLEVGLALADGRLGDLLRRPRPARTCSTISRSSTFASTWPRRTRSPSCTFTLSRRPPVRGAMSTVCRPIRLPTTVRCAATSPRLAAAEFDGHRHARTAAATAGSAEAATAATTAAALGAATAGLPAARVRPAGPAAAASPRSRRRRNMLRRHRRRPPRSRSLQIYA